MLSKYLLLLLILFYFRIDEVFSEKMSMDIVRHKSAFEQYLTFGPKMEQYLKFKPKPKPNRDNDSIALRRFLNDEFYGEIVIGHPGQKLLVSFDTSWQVSWVVSSRCNSIKAIGCYFHNKYDHDKSSEYKKDNRPFSLDIGNFNLTGFYSYDNISIAHSNVTGQSFVEMVTVPYSFLWTKADGVLGLSLKTSAYDPFFYTLLNQKKIKNPLFSIYLNRDLQSNKAGNIMLGFVDDKHVHKNVINNKTVPENFTYLSVDNNIFYWQFDMQGIFLNTQQDPPRFCTGGCKATVDTSSNTIFGPKADVDVIHDKIGASEFFMGRFTVNCDTVNKLPKINFQLNGKNFTLEGPDYTVKMSYRFVTVCVSSFMQSEDTRWVLGGAFLANFYSVYNIQDRTIGFVRVAK